MAEFVMPSLGADMDAGTLVAWTKSVGEHVARGEILAEVETDKAISARALSREHGLETRGMIGSARHGVVTRGDVLRALEAPRRRKITPYARARARELGVALDGLASSSTKEVIVAADVERAARDRSSAPDAGAPPPDAEAITPEQRMRRAIGAAMARSKREIPHYYVGTTIDLEPALARLERYNASVPVAERVLPAVLLLRAAAVALAKVPELNAHCIGETAPAIERVDLGVAIALRKGGLVAPPIVDAANKRAVAIMRALDELVVRARSGQMTASDLRGGTITVTILGDRGVESLHPIIFPPQVAIVGFGKIVVRPWVVDGAIVPRRVVTATLAADHRFSDGHRGGLYLAALEASLASADDFFAPETGERS